MIVDIFKEIKQRLETEKAFGIHGLEKIPTAIAVDRKPEKEISTSTDKADILKKAFHEMGDCRLCPLSMTRTHLVFGQGSAEARLMFVGEAPGYEEDQQGLPFVGAAGQLLTKIIEAMKLTREKVYIANCLKCRPPNNRSPLSTEIVLCKPFLLRQIQIIQPKVICALGKFAAQTLLETEEPISRLRGRFFDWKGTRLMPTFHPAYLLRNPADKKLVWEDMQQIMKELEIR